MICCADERRHQPECAHTLDDRCGYDPGFGPRGESERDGDTGVRRRSSAEEQQVANQ